MNKNIMDIDIMAGIFFFLIGGFMLVIALTESREAQLIPEAASWPTTQGVVMESGLRGGEYGDFVILRYEYEVDGRMYSGSEVGFGVNGTVGSDVAKYPEGKQVTVYYQPGNPRTAVLEPHRSPKRSAELGYLAVSGLLVLLGLAMLFRSVVMQRKAGMG